MPSPPHYPLPDIDRLWRGLRYGVPLGIVLWLLLGLAVRCVYAAL